MRRWNKVAAMIAVLTTFSVTIALVPAGLATSAEATPAVSTPRPAGEPIPRIGAYADDESRLNALGQDIGAPVSFVDAFLDTDGWGAIDNPAVIDWYLWEYPGYPMVWNIPMLPMVSYAVPTAVGGTSLTAEARGAYDRHFVTLAKELVAAGQGHAYVRLGWEMNGSWYPWSEDRCPGTWHPGKRSCFVEAWQKIVTAMRSVRGAKFSFEWVPYIGTQSAASSWPGKAYVNVIGLDVYDWNTGGRTAAWAHQLTAATGLDWLARTARRLKLPETIGEWGLTKASAHLNGPVRYFVAHIIDWIYRHDVVNAALWDSKGLSNPYFALALRRDLRGRRR